MRSALLRGEGAVAVSPLVLLLVVILILLLAGGGWGYRAGWYGPGYGQPAGIIGLIIAIILIVLLLRLLGVM